MSGLSRRGLVPGDLLVGHLEGFAGSVLARRGGSSDPPKADLKVRFYINTVNSGTGSAGWTVR
jgi:hypothetical protein